MYLPPLKLLAAPAGQLWEGIEALDAHKKETFDLRVLLHNIMADSRGNARGACIRRRAARLARVQTRHLDPLTLALKALSNAVNSDAGTVTYINPFSLFLNPMTGAKKSPSAVVPFHCPTSPKLQRLIRACIVLLARSFHRFFTGVLKNSRKDGNSCRNFRMFFENVRICHEFFMSFSRSKPRFRNPVSPVGQGTWHNRQVPCRLCPCYARRCAGCCCARRHRRRRGAQENQRACDDERLRLQARYATAISRVP